MNTVIKARDTMELVSNHDKKIPLHDDLSVDYNGWMTKMILLWPNNDVNVDRDLTKVY